MPVGPRAYGGASARIAVPVALPHHLRAQMRELVSLRSKNRGLGDAENLLATICGEADRTKTGLLLTVEPEADIDKGRLARWYQRHGFAPIQAAPLLMARMAA